MPKLVLLSEGFAGRACELKAEKTTIGRLEDNAFQISEPSVSSHHCEVLLKGNDISIKDLNSTNGTFINGEQVKEAALKHGQVLRLGTVELRVDTGAAGATRPIEPRDAGRGVKMGDFDPTKKTALDKNSPFHKKSNKTTVVFISIVVVLVILLIGVLFVVSQQMGK